MTIEHELAWAAGVFDGDGTACGYVPRQRRSRIVQLTVYQSTTPVLERFRRALSGHGGIHGPYRDRLFHWTTKRKEAVELACRLLWPHLGSEKRAQLRQAIAGVDLFERAVAAAAQREAAHELAWAAGFFDAEGSLTVTASGAVTLEIAQAAVDGQPSSCLIRFHEVLGVGRISGPRSVPSPWSKLPQYRWVAASSADVASVASLLTPFAGKEKHSQLMTHVAAGPRGDQSPSGRATSPAGTFG